MICNNCGTVNDLLDSNCVSCGEKLKVDKSHLPLFKQKIVDLEKEFESKFKSLILAMKKEFGTKIRLLNDKIEEIERKVQTETTPSQASKAKDIETSKTMDPDTIPIDKAVQTPITKQEESLAPAKALNKAKEKPKAHRKIDAHVTGEALKEESSSWLSDFFLGPFSPLWDFFMKSYLHYKKENKMAIFFLTITGIITFLLGFGFLLQYSYNNYFNELAKVSMGFVLAFVFIGLGFYLIKKNINYKQYGSALIGLGLSINYLSIYFFTTYFQISSPLIGFVLIVINTLLAAYLALRFETKIVAVITLLAGAIAPFYIDATGFSTVFYFIYLGLLTLVSYYISIKINWKTINFLAFITSSIIIEYSLIYSAERLSFMVYSIILHSFAYFFFYQNLFDKFSVKSKLTKLNITIILANITLFSLNHFYLSQNWTSLGFIYLLNGLFFLGVSFLPNVTTNKKIRTFVFILSGALIGLAIPALLDWELMGFFWAQEALLLILSGFIFALPGVRKKGYILFFLAIGKIVYVSYPHIIAFKDQSLFSSWFINVSILALFFYALKTIMDKYYSVIEPYEKLFLKFIEEALAVTLTLIFFLITFYYFDLAALNLSILPMFALLYWGYKKRLFFSQTLALSLYFFIATQIAISIYTGKSFHFADQSLYGKIALFECIGILWLLQFYYEKLLPKSKLINFAKNARIFFYFLVPILILKPAKKYIPNYSESILWISVLVNFSLYAYFKHKILKVELYIFTALASMISFYFYFNSHLAHFGNSFLSISLGAFLLLAMIVYDKGFSRKGFRLSEYRAFFTFTIFYISFYLFASTIHVFKNSSFILLSVSLYFTLLVYFKSTIFPARSSYKLLYRIAQVLTVFSILVLFIRIAVGDPGNNNGLILLNSRFSTALLFIILLIQYPLIFTRNSLYKRKYKGIWLFDLHFFHLLFMGFYLNIIYKLTNELTGLFVTVALVIHGILLLFYTLNNKYKFLYRFSFVIFAVAFIKLFLHDLADFTFIHKVIVFMVIGVILLLAAFLFQKLKLKVTIK